jgi:predicted kinase
VAQPSDDQRPATDEGELAMKIVAQVSRKALIRVSSVLACSDMASALLVHSEDEQKGMNPTRAIARRGRGVKKHRPTGRFCRGGGGGAWRPETASGVQFLPVHMTPAVVLRTDVLRKELFKVKEWDRLPESAYRPEITAQVYETTAKRAERILSQGHSVVIDAVFARESERTAINDVARRLNIRFVGLFLVTDLATRLRRVALREKDASDATPALARLQDEYDLGGIDWTVIDASGLPEQTVKRCQTCIAFDPKQAPV